MYDDEESGGRKKNDRLTITCKDKKRKKKVWTATRGRSMQVARPMIAAELVTKEWTKDGWE